MLSNKQIQLSSQISLYIAWLPFFVSFGAVRVTSDFLPVPHKFLARPAKLRKKCDLRSGKYGGIQLFFVNVQLAAREMAPRAPPTISPRMPNTLCASL